MMAYEHDKVRPDIVSVGKALSGGIMPVSGAFANNNVML
jgi:ornithine--oxo-acid transaminase